MRLAKHLSVPAVIAGLGLAPATGFAQAEGGAAAGAGTGGASPDYSRHGVKEVVSVD